jgi:DNA mismatch repair protein MutL
MADIIQLLPDAIANQIAAGEVIQRPASVVKELLENAIDAGATQVKLIIKDAGRTLIQVIDNGCGMTEMDARMAFERHATSKIRKAEDLFAIRTMGFRGEALASIAAVAQVEMRTRQQVNELGIRLVIEGSEVKTHEACQCTAGTNLSVKNLFYNVPARRNFLKSDKVEWRHIEEEFKRVALANPDVFFSLHRNGQEIWHLSPGNLRQRATAILGSQANKKLVPVLEETDILSVRGFIGKPEFARKTRGEQYFFVNQRYIRSPYLNHAVMGAFEDLLPPDTFPLYLLFLELNPTQIDINVHPTKQEIKFEDERLVYQFLRVAVRHALGQYAVMPSIDFEQEPSFIPPAGSSSFRQRAEPSAADFEQDPVPSAGGVQDWETLLQGIREKEEETPEGEPETLIIGASWSDPETDGDHKTENLPRTPYQLHNRYILSQIKSGFLLIDQQAAHERILYEQYLHMLKERKSSSQKLLFPVTLTFDPSDAGLLQELLPAINNLGFDMQQFGRTSFVVSGLPAELENNSEIQHMLESLLEGYKQNEELQLDLPENLARSLARSAAMQAGKELNEREMQSLLDRLFACSMPQKSPGGRKCYLTFDLDELAKRFDS